jgi:hypothetical protein
MSDAACFRFFFNQSSVTCCLRHLHTPVICKEGWNSAKHENDAPNVIRLPELVCLVRCGVLESCGNDQNYGASSKISDTLRKILYVFIWIFLG